MSSKPSWRDRLFGGLKGTSQRLSGNLAGIVGAGRLEAQDLDQIEDALIMSDLGPETAAQIRDPFPPAIRMIEQGIIDLKPLVTHVVPLEEYASFMQGVTSGEVGGYIKGVVRL